MSSTLMNKRKTQLLALVSVIILIGMGLTVLLSPTEADSHPYLLTLDDVPANGRIRNVAPGAPPDDCAVFQMTLERSSTGSSYGVEEVKLEVINKTYFNSQKQHWSFTFLGVTDNTYELVDDTPVTVLLKVCFLLDEPTYECEKVTFTIGGHNLSTDKKNETHLSPRGGLFSDVEYLTVSTGLECDPFWEPSTYYDRQTHFYFTENEYHITLRNLGTSQTDIWISDWEIWRDVNENGIIDIGDHKNDYYNSGDLNFDLKFENYASVTIPVGQEIPMLSLQSEELKVTVTIGDWNEVPEGQYLIKIAVDASCNPCEYWDILKLCVCNPEDNPEPCVNIIYISEGWNLVSVGVEMDELGFTYKASHFAAEINGQAGEDIIKYVVRWHGNGYQPGEYEEYVVDSGIGVNFPIDEGEGYYLYSTSPFEVEFFIVGDCPKDKTFDLLECWNLIGYRSMTPVNVEVWAAQIEAHFGGMPFIQAIVRYDKDLNSPVPNPYYDAWYPGNPDGQFQVKQGEAYWIFSATDKYGAPFPE